MSVKRKKTMGKGEKFAKYFLLFLLLSFLGWAFEMGVVYLQSGEVGDRGLLNLPVCPIYGVSLLFAYFLLGTPQKGRGILRGVKSPILRNLLYMGFAFLIPTAAELIVGLFFEKFFQTYLWSYCGMPMNFRGHISLIVSLGWMIAVYLFMGLLFEKIKRGVFKLPKVLSILLAYPLFFTIIVDLVVSMSALR